MHDDAVDHAAFERLVVEELDRLPDQMVEGLENLAFVIEDDSAAGDLLGEYDGVDLTRRDHYGFGELPDRIVLYRIPHLRESADLDALRAEIHTTLVHEIGHYFGLDDDRLHALGWA